MNKKSEWSSRLVLEALCHRSVQFVTLTYDPKHLPDSEKFDGGNLRPADLRDWLKRLRSRLAYEGRPGVRYFAVGEYGGRTKRAHYHAILYSAEPLSHDLVHQSWGFGLVDVQAAGAASLQYVCGYVVKKFLNQSVYEGRVKPFTRVSRRPGLGALAVPILRQLVEDEHLEFGDVPRMWVHGGKQKPLGRTVRAHLRQALFADRSDAVREEAGEATRYWMYRVLTHSQDELRRMLVESEKAAQQGLRALERLEERETL